MPEAHWRRRLLLGASAVLHLLAFGAVLFHAALWPWALTGVLLNHLLIAALGLWPRSRWLGPNWTRLPAAAAARHEIALTIDDGPDPVVTPLVLDLLQRYAVKATFFVIGENALRYPALCREIVRRGHALENHSQHHRHYFSLLGPRAMARELQEAQDTLISMTGQRPLFFRAPAGLRNLFLAPILTRLGLRLATWSVRAFDTRVKDAARVQSQLLGGLQAGAILLLHDGHAARTTQGTPVLLEVLPAVLTRAADAGLRFVTLRQALLP
ncbi:MAG: polysaccharide deacetylase family protein [Gammaproteobacteria bacterium]|uniref:polysaccharide deacetylase family protein n=1 Tax=Rhodoferax sp. TaxID=50421 RepID=UPI0017D4EC33|nr:polysaccharide deacetylase family protein [Rhodoferax sp.]MBU3898341.1 polysaccharide deacetylase family protein [Gammaproteobacteria bacterium]MBA3058684.1 polysaccharide deacetylase family protein [Rhodoferax sp.]MBU3996174.1 polysaccharide deacetylase family protein [Gammaproteobacteria bacterium]MBU4081526.1 polysaccharide deacetylase family protein [Gammaproteobacteria bacterium]MBU4114905.1 polysaccharide deacetylase family protein [Gammaproteobacteria bacterium]